MTQTAALYTKKPRSYFSGARADMVSLLPNNPAANILELGCGDGSTGALARAAGKAATYTGIELDAEAADIATSQLSTVIVGDIASLDLSSHHGCYDALIASEVIEHLIDPAAVLAKLIPCLRPGALVLASSPNVSHWRVIAALMCGRFEYADTGVMDRSHLRWFTPKSYAALFSDTGLHIVSTSPITPHAMRSRWINWVTRGRSRHLFMSQINLVAKVPDQSS